MNLKPAALFLLLVLLSAAYGPLSAQDATPDATAIAARCGQPASAVTPEATATAEATAEVTQAASAPLRFTSFLPTDVKFNPDEKNPVVVVMVFSLIFENQQAQPLDLRAPKFELAIDGVPWGEVASTDFQMAHLLAHAEQGIVLQSLTFAAKTSDAQKAVLQCIANRYPVDLTLSGKIDVMTDGEPQPVEVVLTSPQVIIQPRQSQS